MDKHKLTSNLAVSLQHFGTEKPVSVREPVNHIWIYDRSGSMGWTLEKLTDDLFNRAVFLKPGDFLTLGYFSGVGQHRLIIKGFKMVGPNDRATLNKILQANNTTIGLTCFSEVLGDVADVVSDLAELSKNFALVFFTDGCPVPDTAQERSAIEKAIKAVRGNLMSSLFVGYGDYYNRPLMQKMAGWAGGALVHSENLSRFDQELGVFMESTGKGGQALKVDVPDAMLSFYLQGGNVVTVPMGEQSISACDDNVIYSIDRGNSKKSKAEVGTSYACALALSRSGYSDLALEVIGEIGDKHLANKLSNAFTVSELGNAEEAMKAAITDMSARFLGGKELGCVPARDAFCVVDVLQLLAADKDAVFYPGNEDFKYKRIGAKSKPKEGYPKFERDDTKGCRLSDLVWNDSRLNCSVQARIPGKIKLDEQAASFMFGSYYSTSIFRNYAVIQDGRVNVEVLPCSMSEVTFDTLKKHEAINPKFVWVRGNVYPVSLAGLPVMNRAMCDGKKSAKKLAEMLIQELELQAKVKALKYYYAKLDPEGELKKADVVLTPEQVAYLEKFGVVRGSFSPTSETEPAHDVYLAKAFEVKIAKFSSLPSVDKVLASRKDGKKLTPSESLMLRGIVDAEAIANNGATKVLEGIEAWSGTLRNLRDSIQKTKFAILLGNQWFDDLPRTENASLDFGGYTLTFNVKEVEVKI